MSPRVLDDLPLSIRQRFSTLWTILTLHLSSPYSQQLRRWRGRRRRLPARHPPAAQQPRGSQEGPGKVGSEGGGEGDGELRPHGGSWETAGVRRGAERRKKRRRGWWERRQAALTVDKRKGKMKLPILKVRPTTLSYSKLSVACPPSTQKLISLTVLLSLSLCLFTLSFCPFPTSFSLPPPVREMLFSDAAVVLLSLF